MKAERPSRTAHFFALGRAMADAGLSHLPNFRSVGFVVKEDSSIADWNNRFAQSKAKVERGFYMRIAIAHT